MWNLVKGLLLLGVCMVGLLIVYPTVLAFMLWIWMEEKIGKRY